MTPRSLRKCIKWCRANGVIHLKLPDAEFTLDPNWAAMQQALAVQRAAEPTQEEVDKLAHSLHSEHAPTIVGGMEQDLVRQARKREAEIDIAAVGYPLDPFAQG